MPLMLSEESLPCLWTKIKLTIETIMFIIYSYDVPKSHLGSFSTNVLLKLS